MNAKPGAQINTERLERLALHCYSLIREICLGIWHFDLPVFKIVGASGILFVVFRLHWDYFFFRALNLNSVYPTSPKLYCFYRLVIVGSPIFVWALRRLALKNQLAKRIEEVFVASGLKNRLGKTPEFIADYPIDEVTRVLRIKNAFLPLTEFQKARPGIEAGLSIYIDEVREDRKEGRIELVYAREPMPEHVEFSDAFLLENYRFIIGLTRSKDITVSLKNIPHFLIAGQTGGGKSTLQRQIITTLYLKNPGAEFTLVDLKGGMEFQLFQDLPRVKCPIDSKEVLFQISQLASTLEGRMKLIRESRAKDIDDYNQNASTRLNRHVIVIDEAAELFLGGNHSSKGDTQKARQVLSQIARQGRSIGVHLIVATQRPDVRALDPQVKANLPGIVCFQMANDISSMTVLGNGRATHLPSVPGRAFWKAGTEMIEVQTPYLSMESADSLLSSHRQAKANPQSPASNLQTTTDQKREDLAGY